MHFITQITYTTMVHISPYFFYSTLIYICIFSLLTAIILHKLFYNLPFFQPVDFHFSISVDLCNMQYILHKIFFTTGFVHVWIFKLGPYVAVFDHPFLPWLWCWPTRETRLGHYPAESTPWVYLCAFPDMLFSYPISYKRSGLSYIWN